VERAARDYLGEDVEAIGRHELIARLGRGEIVLINVRPPQEYAAGHIEGRSIPLDELEHRLTELPADREIVAYCRRPVCAYAHDAVRRLRAAGRPARRLDEGWPQWRLMVTRARRAGPRKRTGERRWEPSTRCGHHVEGANDEERSPPRASSTPFPLSEPPAHVIGP
jgi:rhodanese-related sulfurtransferase